MGGSFSAPRRSRKSLTHCAIAPWAILYADGEAAHAEAAE
jgi:hypothetical protein